MGFSTRPCSSFRSSGRASHCRPRLEPLEARALPATLFWVCDSGDWATPECWDLGRLPEPTDDVLIDRGDDITVTHSQGSSDVHSMTSTAALVLEGGTLRVNSDSVLNGPFLFTGGTLAGTGEVSVNGPLTWAGGSLGLSGSAVRVLAYGGLDLPGGGSRRMETGSLENYGVGTWTGEIRVVSPAVVSQFINRPEAMLTVTGPATFGSQGGALRNEGTLSSQGEVRIQGQGTSFYNSGYLEVLSGTLTAQSSGSVSATGLQYIAAGASLGLHGASTGIGPDAFVWGEGSLTVTADMAALRGTIEIGGDLRLGPSFGIEVTSPSLIVGGQLTTRNGQNNFRGSAVTAGSVVVEGGTLNLANGSNLYVATDLTTAGGTVSVSADSLAYAAAAVRLMRGGAALTGGALLAEQGVYVAGGTLAGHGIVGSDLINAGLVRLGGSGTVTGELVVLGNYSQTADGLLTGKLGGTEVGSFDQLTVQGSITLAGTLTVTTLNAFTPVAGDEFRVLNSAGRQSAFARHNLPSVPGLLFLPDYDDVGLTLVTTASGPGSAPGGGQPGPAAFTADMVAAALGLVEPILLRKVKKV